jgi:hypothetical protein
MTAAVCIYLPTATGCRIACRKQSGVKKSVTVVYLRCLRVMRDGVFCYEMYSCRSV